MSFINHKKEPDTLSLKHSLNRFHIALQSLESREIKVLNRISVNEVLASSRLNIAPSQQLALRLITECRFILGTPWAKTGRRPYHEQGVDHTAPPKPLKHTENHGCLTTSRH